jgi:hypothetical protein
MALDWKKAVKPASSVAEFSKSAPRAAKSAKEVVMSAIDKQIELFNKPKEEGRRWFDVKGDQVGFTIRYANSPLKLVGDETVVVVPKAQFVEVMESIKTDVEKDAFKAQLDAQEAKVRKRSEAMAKTRAAKKK